MTAESVQFQSDIRIGWAKRNTYRAALAAIVAICAGCSVSDQNNDAAPTTSVAVPSTAIAPTTTVAPGATLGPTTTVAVEGSTTTIAEQVCQFDHNTNSTEQRIDERGFVQLQPNFIVSEISTGNHYENGECFDRIVLRFSNPSGAAISREDWPGIRVGYVDQPMQDPLGEPLAIQGNAFLQIEVGSWLYGEGGGDGPMRIEDDGLSNVFEVAVSSNYEGHSTYVIGMNEKADFAFGQLTEIEDCEVLCVYFDIKNVPPYINPENS